MTKITKIKLSEYLTNYAPLDKNRSLKAAQLAANLEDKLARTQNKSRERRKQLRQMNKSLVMQRLVSDKLLKAKDDRIEQLERTVFELNKYTTEIQVEANAIQTELTEYKRRT